MKYRLLSILLFFTSVQGFAQWECPSHLAAHLDPIGDSQFLFGAEAQLSTGLLDGNSINTAMGFIGFDYSTTQHSLYFEGGIKNWWKYDFDEEILFDNHRFGLREVFYQFRGDINGLTIGLQSSSFDDHYLLNERIAGLNWKMDFGKWKLNTYAGSVTKDFARNGIFCTTGFIYDLPTGQDQIILGNSLGDKNLAGFTFTYFPDKKSKSIASDSDSDVDEFEVFEDDEFESTDEFESFDNDEFERMEPNQAKKSISGFGIDRIGFAAYSEFGDWINNTFYHTGLFASVRLPGDFYLNPEALFQIENNNKGIIYLLELEKTFNINNGARLSLNAGYYGFSEIDKNAMVLNSYSNILAGEVLRLDAVNMPFYLAGLKYSIPSAKLSFKLQNAGQLNGGDLNEWDFEVSKRFKDKLHLNLKGGVIDGGDLEEKAFLGRIEARFYF